MARRKGSSRGKSTVNARKTSLENAREKLRDDPGGTREQQQQQEQDQVVNITNMEATTTANTTTTTKYYNKTKLQNNNHQQNKQTSSTSTTAITTNNKKTQQTTYREAKETNETQQMVETTPTQKKLTAKQAKAAAKIAAQQQQQNAKSDSNNQQQQQQQQNEASKKIIQQEKEGKSNVTNIPATSTKTNTTAINANNTSSTTQQRNTANAAITVAVPATTANNISNSSSSNNRNNHNNSSNMNTSDNSVNSTIRDQQQQQHQLKQNENSNRSDNQQQPLSDNNSTSSWNNSKYLHKKFKRLASTTENDVLQEAEKLRTTSMSSASSSVSSPPPPPTTHNLATTQKLPQQQKLLETAAVTASTSIIKNEEHLTNGVLNKHETQQLLNEQQQHANNNTFSQNQVLQQLVQQQQQCNVNVSSSSTEISNTASMVSSVVASNMGGSGASGVTLTTTSSSTAGGGGRYKCPYCDLSCTKPSVLQKHIRAHTNERPYPCEICGIAFKTKSNLYKHCRSRSHAARQKGIEVSPDADDGLSDQDVDPELSNSSSEMLSRTESPIDEQCNTNQQTLTAHSNEPHVLTSGNNDSTISSAPLTAAKPNFLQQPAQQQSQILPLGSPAAGTLPPTSTTVAPNNNTQTTTGGQKQSIDYKPYKPKFHNASLYNTAKEATTAAAVATSSTISSLTSSSSALTTTIIHTLPATQKEVAVQKLRESPHVNMNQQQQHLVVPNEQKMVMSPAGHLLPPQQSPTHMSHHPSLSPSTQMKLNNHISAHQMHHQMQQQQLQQLQAQAQHHSILGPPPPANALPLPLAAAAYYLGQPPGTPTALLHPASHMPAQPFYNPVFASLQMMTPQQQQQFQHQLQIQQQHLQQQQLQQLTHSNIATSIPPPQPTPPIQSPHSSQTSPSVPPMHIKAPTPHTNANNSRSIHHPKANTPSSGNSTLVHPTPQNALHYLANAASVASVTLNPLNPTSNNNNNKNNVEMLEQGGGVISQRTPSHVGNSSSNSNTLLQTSANSGMPEVTLNKEKLNEHINKLISQNEAIVENKELLLQKKYPKTLNRSRSFTNNSGSANSSNSSGSSQVLQTITGGPPSESPTNAKLAQAIVQKQQMHQQQQQQQQQLQQQYIYQQQQQQQQQQMHKQRHMFHDKPNMEEVPSAIPLNGTSKHLVGKHIVQSSQQIHPAAPVAVTNATQYQQYRSIVTITPTQHRQQTLNASTAFSTSNSSSVHNPPLANVPLNLSSKTKLTEETLDLNKPPAGPLPQAPPPATPRKRHSIEQTQSAQNSQLLTPTLALNEASNSSNSNSSTPQPSTSGGKFPPQNNSIIKNLLLNARGLAVPTGTGEDAVYICPLCSFEFRTAEELKLHNSTYCQGSNSSANSPASSPSHKYFRSNSMSLNIPDFKILSKNPLSLAKLAWSQLKTKPSNLVLNRLSASVANTSKNSSTNTTSATSTHPSSQSSANTNTSTACGRSILSVAPHSKPLQSTNEMPMRFVDAPLPSPGPLLGKTPLVDYTLNESKSKSEEVIITKMHDDPLYTNANMADHSASKRLKFDSLDNRYSTSSSTRQHSNTLTSGGDMLLLSAQELSKKEERYKRFTSSGGCMIPLSECDDVDKSPKMIRTPLLSGGSFQEVSPKKETKLPLPLMPGAQLTPKLNLGLSSSNGPQHFQFPPINQITAFNPLTLGLTEKVIPYVPGIPGPNSLQPQLPLAPPTQHPAKQQHLLNVPPATSNKNLSRNASPNRNQTPSPMNMSNTDAASLNKPTFGGVQNVPSEFNKVPPSTNMRNVRNWPAAVNNNASTSSSSKSSAIVNEAVKSSKSFNFMRLVDNLSPRKNSNSSSENKTLNSSSSAQTDTETRHFSLDKMSREQLIIQQPFTNNSKSLSPTNLTLTPLHVDTSNVATVNAPNETSDTPSAEAKAKFLRPTSLPLRPGTFTPKRHHGITPTANTLPLISPETPRPSKECVQLYLNGNSYTYLGLKCSTKTFYCTLNCPQPSYVQDMHKLSMYSMWQQCAENNPHPLGLKPKEVMSLYDSRQKGLIFTMAKGKKITYSLVAAQQTVMTPFISSRDKFYHHQLKPIALKETSPSKDNGKSSTDNKDLTKELTASSSSTNSTTGSQTLEGGYESHENYIYVRGRGRGKYVCSECGIRCKKPSMLKKHIRTHTDVRPYTCKHCNFSFKTKGNLTKHMQSKTHYKKCIELGLNPGPMPAEGDFLEPDVEFDQQSSTSAGGRTSSMGNGESDSEGDSSDNETESSNESDSARSNVTQANNTASVTEDNKSHLEHEAARCLLTLSMTPPIHTQSMETSMANSQITVANNTTTTTTAVSSNTNASYTPTPAIRRVISYTSPKPPFDYQKQEQYYSNPKEHKPKLNNNSSSTFETAPMDLTKPRAMDVVTTPAVTQTAPSFSSNPGPVQTQAQIRDVIFGVNKNESGFLKTMISVSSKVGRNYADNYEENHHKLNEDMMLYDYRREQTLQYYKIKQTQLSRGMSVNPNVMMSNTTPITSPMVTASVSLGQNTVTTSSATESVIVSSSTALETTEQPVVQKEVTANLQLPKIEIVESQETEKLEIKSVTTVAVAVTNTVAVEVPKSDESEETDEEPPAKKVAVVLEEKPAHNANLPAAILQPGTTDFSGVLSGSATSTSNQPTRTVIVGEDGFTTNNNEILPVHPRVPQISNADGRPVCSICSKTFQKQSQLVLHMNIHYMERKYKCDPCGVSFRTQGHLQKHERSEAHKNKVIMTSTFGVPTTSNPRPFECTDCKIAFRIHGHLAKHLRSKTHVQKLECLQKLPFGTYAEIERAGISLTEIDTSDCENSLISLRVLAQKLIEKDPSSKLGSYTTPSGDNSNTGLVSQDSASEDGFTAAERAAATAIASLDNNSAANTPRRANSTSEDEGIALALNNNLKRRLPGNFSNGEESDKEYQDQQEKRLRADGVLNNTTTHLNTASPTN